MRLPNTSRFKIPPLFHLDLLKTINYFKKYEILSLPEASQNLYSKTNQKNEKIIFKKKNRFKVCKKIILAAISLPATHCNEL